MIQPIIFLVLTTVASFYAYRGYRRVWQNIQLGKPEVIEGYGNTRVRNLLLVAFGQKKMFKDLLPAIFHAFIYVAFIVTQIELLEIVVDGLTGHHRVFAEALGGFYTLVISKIEVLSVLALVATLAFLTRRNLLTIPRFQKPELDGFPRRDANRILFGELLLIVGIFSMNGAYSVLQIRLPEEFPQAGFFAISGWLGPLLFGGLSDSALFAIERFGWWLHYLVVLGFLAYLPYSKHLHIVLAFFNVWFQRQKPRGEMENMPVIMNEVKSMMGLTEPTEESTDVPEFGAKDVFDLSWKTLLDAYTCTECGRCTANCPANLTGKKLSPRKIMMDIRDRMEEVGQNIAEGKFLTMPEGGSTSARLPYDDGKSLFDYISREEIHACTTCNACVEACPVLISPLEPILELRRYEILTEATGPSEWVPMFTSIENSGAVWQMPEERAAWAHNA